MQSISSQDSMSYVCRQLGLPLSTIRLLKLTGGLTSEGEKEPQRKLTATEEVERMMQDDKAAGRMPILCVANVHSSIIQVKKRE